MSEHKYDIIIVGGGLAGLSAAIQLAEKKYKVLVLEKEKFPRHKVCGEYISMESKPFLERLGLPVGDMNLPSITNLQVTDTRGNELNAALPLGGFGISRYMLDDALAKLAQNRDAVLITQTKAEDIIWENDGFTVKTRDQVFYGKVVCGAWGKRSNIDVKWQRTFIKERQKSLNNYMGIKYHVRYPWPEGLIGLHNFDNGYCGISRIEDGKCCLCYLTTAANMHRSGNDIKKSEQEILMKNPCLRQIFSNAEFLYESPLAISQISFQKKEQVQEHVLLLGDAAGVITPLCGNGMSMAFHSSFIAVGLIDRFLQGQISRARMEHSYAASWQKTFSGRLSVGRLVQRNFGKQGTTAFFLKAMNALPFLRNSIIERASGEVF